MSKILEAVTQSLVELNDTCGCPAFALRYDAGYDIIVPVPNTQAGREAYHALLLEVGRCKREELAETLSAEIRRGVRPSPEGFVQ